MSKKIFIPEILNELNDEYIVLKIWGKFPEFLPGSDIDILVADKFIASQTIHKFLQKHIDNDDTYITVKESPTHLHLDIFQNKKLYLRFDFVESLDCFSKFSVQNSILVKMFITRELTDFGDFQAYTLSNEFDLLVRYFEYLEWFERRPDKLKHLDYILENATEEEKSLLIRNAHRYILFHHEVWQGDVPVKPDPYHSIKEAYYEIIRLCKQIIKLSFKRIMAKLK